MKKRRTLYRTAADLYYFILTAVRLRVRKAAPVFIYTMGKVGSSSIRDSLKRYYPGVVASGHSFKPLWKSTAQVKAIYHWYHKRDTEEINIISLVREPVARNMSIFFQEYQKSNGFTGNETAEDLLELFVHHPTDPVTWFDRKLKPVFDIDVYRYDFSDYAVIRRGRVNLLLMKSELNDKEKSEIIRDFLGMEELAITRTNESRVRKYSGIYDAFKKIKIPVEYVEKLYASPYCKHFYKDITVQDQIEKWCV